MLQNQICKTLAFAFCKSWSDAQNRDALNVKLGHRRVSLPFSFLISYLLGACYVLQEGYSISFTLPETDTPRQKLQREIAVARGLRIDQVIEGTARLFPAEDAQHGDSDSKSIVSQSEGKSTASMPTKRKYRRHPKVCVAPYCDNFGTTFGLGMLGC